jgi:hypothetical protein
MWTLVIEADTLEDAVKKFENAEWRKWQIADEGVTVQNVIDTEKSLRNKADHVSILINDNGVIRIYEDKEIDTIDSAILTRITKNRSYSFGNGKAVINLEI